MVFPNSPLFASSGRRLAILALGWCAIVGCKSPLDNVDIKDVYGPAGRHAKNVVEQAKYEVQGDSLVGLDEFNAARKLYDDQDYVKARKAFHKIVKNKKTSGPVGEDAMFYRAESDFQLGHLPDAQDGYDELLKKHPSTKYLEQASERLFVIGRYWLDAPKPATEVELVSFTDESGVERLKDLPEATIPYRFALRPNLTDKSRPLFDTQGRALQALNSVHIHDPSGKWADSALMTRATYHLRKKNYRDADIDFNTIRRDYPKSKFAEAAFILGAHASLMSYQGAQYDGKQLDEAKKLTEAALRLYPNSPQRPKLESDLKKIGAEAGDRAWVRVEFHLKRGEKNSAAVYCENIIEKFPESPRAAQAREVLISLGAEHAAGILKTPLFEKEPARPKPSEAPYDEPEEPGRLRISDDDGEPISEAK